MLPGWMIPSAVWLSLRAYIRRHDKRDEERKTTPFTPAPPALRFAYANSHTREVCINKCHCEADYSGMCIYLFIYLVLKEGVAVYRAISQHN